MNKSGQEFEEVGETTEASAPRDRDPFEDLARLTSAQVIRSGEPLPLECPVCGLMNPTASLNCASCGCDFQAEAKSAIVALDKKLCPHCRQTVGSEALECSHCGYSFNPELEARRALRKAEEEIEKVANGALKGSLIGLLCILGVVLGLLFLVGGVFGFMSVSTGWGALARLGKLQADNPGRKLETSARSKALGGIFIGGIELLVGVIYLAITSIGLIYSGRY